MEGTDNEIGDSTKKKKKLSCWLAMIESNDMGYYGNVECGLI